MTIAVSAEFRAICASIVAEQRSIDAWRTIESDDMFQSKHFCGGYNAAEDAFCFSYYSADRSEFWFQITLGEVAAVADGQGQILSIRPADSLNT